MNIMLRMRERGFTLIELLIVIALIGVLAVALLSTINPVEQRRKARDSSRKAAAAELLNSVERFQATFFCWPWEYDFSPTSGDPGCQTTALSGWTSGNTVNDNISVLENALVTRSSEMKGEFFEREVVTAAGDHALYITEDGIGLVHICFEPESNTFQEQANKDASGGDTASTHVCVPE